MPKKNKDWTVGLILLPLLFAGAIQHADFSSLVPVLRNSVHTEQVVAAPRRIVIPKLGIDAVLEDVGINDRGEMDVPKQAAIPGWYSLGYKPGQQGNAVIAGHLDSVAGAPGIFAEINKLVPGDEVIIEDVLGGEFRFRITGSETYKTDEAPVRELFGRNDQPLLRLMTCKGTWIHQENSYDQRLVVTAVLEQNG